MHDQYANPDNPEVELGPMNRSRVLRLALPIMGENLLQTMVIVVDTVMVARLGKEEIAGVGTSAEMVWFIMAILIALQVGATVLVAQAIGAGGHGRANDLAKQAITWGILVAVPVSIGGALLASSAVGLFGVEPDVAGYATTYLEITAATSVAMVLTFVAGAVLRGAGDSRTPFMASIVANVVNIVVAYSLIYGSFGVPAIGVAGSAWGGAAGRATSATILIVILASGRRAISLRGRGGWRPDFGFGGQLARLGVPAALEEMMLAAGFMVMLRVVALLGTAALAAQQIAFNALSIAFMPGFAFATAATALVGQSVGARRLDDARTAFAIAVRWALVWMTIASAIYFILAGPILGAFTSDPDVQDAGTNAVRALALGIPLWALWSVSGGALRGVGDTKTPLIGSSIAVWGAVGLSFVVVEQFDGGLGAVWLMFLITTPIAAFGNFLMFRRRIGAEPLPVADVMPAVAD